MALTHHNTSNPLSIHTCNEVPFTSPTSWASSHNTHKGINTHKDINNTTTPSNQPIMTHTLSQPFRILYTLHFRISKGRHTRTHSPRIPTITHLLPQGDLEAPPHQCTTNTSITTTRWVKYPSKPLNKPKEKETPCLPHQFHNPQA